MKKYKKINQKKAIELIRNGSFSPDYQVLFDSQTVYAADAILLGKNGILVPEELIQYDDNSLDYSDIPSVKNEDFAKGKIKLIFNPEILLDDEISIWLKQQRIDVNELITQLLKNFYRTIKSIKKNIAL